MAVPAAPTGLAATPGDNTASIAFTPDAAASPAITKNQYRVDGKGGWKDVAASPISLSGLANGRAYSVAVRSVNADGNSAEATVSVTPADPSAANDNGFDDASWAANPGLPVPRLDWNDPDD